MKKLSVALVTLFLFSLGTITPSSAAQTFPCPPHGEKGDLEVASEMVRFLVSGFGFDIPEAGLSCLKTQAFPLFKVPSKGTESSDGTSGKSRTLEKSDQIQITRIQSFPGNRLRVEFQILKPGNPTELQEVEILKYVHPRAQAKMGCASVLKFPSLAYRPVPGFCPGRPLPPSPTPSPLKTH